MTIQAQIEALESLAAVDAELKELTDALNTERDALEGKRSLLSSLQDRFNRSTKSIEEMERVRGDLTGELRQMNNQIEKSREKLSRCRTERESNAVQRELEELRKLHRDREIEIEKIDGLLSQARTELEQTTKERDALAADLGAIEGDVVGRLTVAEKQVAEKTTVREGLLAKVQPALYRRYELLRKRKGSAIAYTTDGTCSACHMRLQPMLFQKLTRSDEFSQCPSCARILYFKPPQDGAEADQSGGP